MNHYRIAGIFPLLLACVRFIRCREVDLVLPLVYKYCYAPIIFYLDEDFCVSIGTQSPICFQLKHTLSLITSPELYHCNRYSLDLVSFALLVVLIMPETRSSGSYYVSYLKYMVTRADALKGGAT